MNSVSLPMQISAQFDVFRCRGNVPEAVAVNEGNSIEVVVTNLAELGLFEIAARYKWLSPMEQQRARRFIQPRSRQRFIACRSQLRQLLGSRLGVFPASVDLAVGVHGKPALAGRFAAAKLHFNVARHEDLAVYAFAQNRKVGVDVEAVVPLDDADDIVRHFFSRREQAAYRALDKRDKLVAFFNGWTRKEAFAKALGKGLFHALDSFDVSLAPGDEAEIIRLEEAIGQDCRWKLQNLTLGSGLVGALVVQQFADDSTPKISSKFVAPCRQ